VPREARALNAVVEPMLTRERRMVMQNDTMTELRGMSQPGCTWDATLVRFRGLDFVNSPGK